MSGMTVRLEPHDDGSLTVLISGALDEAADFHGLFASLGEGAGTVVLDLAGVERLNSIGVHRWIDALGPFSAKRRILVQGCSYVVALQANCVANLFGSAEVRSTLAPYYCAGCRDTRMMNVTVEELALRTVPAKRCPTCDAALAFDELDSYFDFLAPRGV